MVLDYLLDFSRTSKTVFSGTGAKLFEEHQNFSQNQHQIFSGAPPIFFLEQTK